LADSLEGWPQRADLVAVASAPARKRPRKAVRFAVCVAVGLLLAVPIYVGLAKAELIRSPFFPRVEGEIDLARSDRDGIRVLFVGNSFTYYNSMPALVRELAVGDPGGPAIFPVSYTAPNWNLEKAADDDGLADLLDSVRWDAVVLQEQSQMLSFPAEWRRRNVHPVVRELDRKIFVRGSQTILFMSWGYLRGDDRNSPSDTYAAMQERLARASLELGRLLDVDVAPVGLAWAEAIRRRPSVKLWADDGRHPSKLGSYLAACVFYAILSRRDPAASPFTAGLPEEEASFLRRVAGDVAIRSAAVWRG
jgi:hypothetical protein